MEILKKMTFNLLWQGKIKAPLEEEKDVRIPSIDKYFSSTLEKGEIIHAYKISSFTIIENQNGVLESHLLKMLFWPSMKNKAGWNNLQSYLSIYVLWIHIESRLLSKS